MLMLISVLIGLLFFVTNGSGQTTRTVGVSGNYTTLKLAFDAINAGTITGSITLQITGNTTETSSAVLNASGNGSANYTTVSIYPTSSGLIIAGNLNLPLIDLNGADHVTIDGRVNGSGSVTDLTITNSSTGITASTVRFVNSAENNTVKYLTIKGSETSAATSNTTGIIFFSTSSSGNGNDGNTIDHNNITSDAAGRATHAIYSLGSSDHSNSEDIISNNNIYDFLNNGLASCGVHISSNSTSWTISGNSLFETTSFIPTADVAFNAMVIDNSSGTGFTITGNYIGGSSASCGGQAWTKTNSKNNIFYAINLNAGTSPVSNIQGNTIQNFSWSNSGSQAWTGIQCTVGSVNVGTTAGNIIGATSGTGSITVTGGASGLNVYGINIAGSGTITIRNNKIGAITAANSNISYASNFYGINKANTGTGSIIDNIIGSTITTNSILASSASTANDQIVSGISNTNGSNGFTISNNTISNLTNGTTNANTGAAGLIVGISSSSAVNIILNNTISYLTIANANSAANNTASICGIALTGTNQLKTITGNTICYLSNNCASFTGSAIGLYFGATGMYTTNSHTVTGNFIHDISVNVSSTGASVYGIKISTGQTTYANNIISLGGNTATTIYGIYETGTASNNNNIYFNSVFIAGNLSSGVTDKSYCLYSAGYANTRIFKNNIFENARSTTGGTSLHYAAFFNYGVSTSLSLDFNDYYTPGTGGVLGFYNGADVNAVPLISGLDGKSLAINPTFSSPGGTEALNYTPLSDKLEGTTISTLSTDYASVNRAATPSMGAYEVTLSLNADVYKSGVFQSSYFRLKDAFDKINNGTHTGVLEIRIKANMVETVSAVLYQSGYSSSAGISNYSSLTIYPTVAGITVTGNFDSPLIDLNGADNVTIDGRVNQSGATDLTIANASTGTFASAIRFIISAESNTVKYCNITSSCNSAGVGAINFTSSTTGNGNDNNIIEFCNISNTGGNRPVNIIFSSGTSGRENSGNIIRYNNIYNFFNPNSNSYGINISSNSTDWTISDNSFYETTTFAPYGANKYYPIFVNTGNNNIISNNYIGGSEPLCGGSAFTVNASLGHYFCGIYFNGGVACMVQNNIIRNINYTSIQSNPWDGIFINSGNATVTGNTIGAATGTGSIVITTPSVAASATMNGGVVTAITLLGGGTGYTTAPPVTFSTSGSTIPATATATIAGGVVTTLTLNSGGSGYTGTPNVVFDGQSYGYSTSHGMIQNSSGAVNITNNNIGSITTAGTAYYSHSFESIYVRSVASTLAISNNLIGSLTTANSILTSSSAVSSVTKQDVYGIYSAGIGTTTISGNTIANLTNAYAGTNSLSRVRGIQTIAGYNTIQNNTVSDLTSFSKQSTPSTSASIVGISQTSSTSSTVQTVTGNTICNLFSTSATAQIYVTGIYYSGPTTGSCSVSGNFIHSLSIASSDVTSNIKGIELNYGGATCANNIVSLGNGLTSGYFISGIWDESGATNNNNIYFNTVYIGGSVTSGTTSSTAALKNSANSSTRNYRNNILFNARSGGSSGKHYSIILSGIANLTIDYNDYFALGTGGMLGVIGTLDKPTLSAWKAATGQDVYSLSTNPVFAGTNWTTASNYYTTTSLPGGSGTGITTDYAGNTRGITPKMGALEINSYIWQGSTSTDFAAVSNWTGGTVPPDGADISFATAPDRDCYLDQNRTIGDITNAQSTRKLVVNGKQLTITKNLNFTNGAQIDATTASSCILFTGMSAQNIPAGIFTGNTVETIGINNISGVTLNGNLTISGTLILSNGSFSLGMNTLTLDGAIVTSTGSLTGGSATNLIIGGSGSSATLPAVSLNNFTINRPNGLVLGGSVTVGGTLALTDGTLIIGANMLTMAGNSLTKSTGNIDASNAGAAIIFLNTTAIIFPPSLFTSTVNDLTIGGAGGITSSSDLTVNGVLDLEAANPSGVKGCLDMVDGSIIKTLLMGPNATTTGTGDVTGIVSRSSFVVNTPYSFGNKFTTLNMAAGGTLPSSLSFKIILSSSDLSWKPDAIRRYYDIIRTGGTSATKVTLNLHYLDSELNGASEGNLDLFDYHLGGTPHIDDHGHSNDNTADNWVGLANLSLTYVARTAFNDKYWMLGTSTAANYTWLGVTSDWASSYNWLGGVVPSSGNHVTIPDAGTTPFDPDLPATATIGSLTIQAGGILNGGTDNILTIDGAAGAWDNMGTFNAGNSTVVFTNAAATMSDPTNFYNVTVADGAKLTLGTDNILRIAGTLSLSTTGILNAAYNHNTVEYNGDIQTVINPNGVTPGYYNLILSGTGTKTLPGTDLSIANDFTISGSVSATAASMINLTGELTIGVGCTFATGNYNHFIGGYFDNSGIFNASSGYTITLNGIATQSIYGSSTTIFDNLTINNSMGVTLFSNVNVDNVLTLANGTLSVEATTLGINGAISKTYGNIDVNSNSSLSFGGTSSLTLPDNIFTATPSINNLTINRSGGVAMGNQNMIINGLLNLEAGTVEIGANTLTINGSSPTRTTGNIDAGNPSGTLVFSNISPITLPSFIFTDDVNNLIINSSGGITASSDFTINGILNLQSDNPSAIKGSLDMWNGTALKTLTMGPSATTIGTGDVTGIVKRTSFLANTPYSFGNQFTTIVFSDGGTYPSEIKAKISIGASPSWKTTAIQRMYDFVQTDGVNCISTITTHYLDTELNGNIENELVQWTRSPGTPDVLTEWGRSNCNSANNWVAIANVNIGYYPTSFGQLENTLAKSEIVSYIWNGSQSTAWATIENWTPTGTPSSTSNVVVPDASTTNFSPTIPTSVELKTLTIEAAGILNANEGIEVTINGSNGAWSNAGGTYNPNTSIVTFTNANATISGSTNFNNVTIPGEKVLWMQSGSTMRISGTMINNGTWRTVIGGPTTVEYSGGNQTVVVPNPTTNRYSTLILSGSGTKTMPSTALAIYGDFSILGTATATAIASVNTNGNFIIGSDATFRTGALSHSIGGNFSNDGVFSATGSTIEFNGSAAQVIGGIVPAVFNNLTLNNKDDVSLGNNETINGILAFTSGKIYLGDHDLLMGNAATITGNTNTKYVVTDGTGVLNQRVNTSTDVIYPIGFETSYLPLTIRLTALSTADNIKARVANGLFTSYDASDFPTGTPITNRVVPITWYLNESASGGSNATVTFQWNATDEASTFNRKWCDVAHYTGGAWSYAEGAIASGSNPYTQTISGITSFHPFGVFGQHILSSFMGTTFCAGSSISVDYTATGGTWNSGNNFTAEISDAAGSFTSPVAIGSAFSQESGTINATIPANTDDGTGYRVRVVSADPAGNGEINGDDLTINHLRSISGSFSYANTANSALTDGITVKLYQNNTQVGSSFVVTNGIYEFTNLCPGNYEIRATSVKSTEGSVNTTDAAQANYWGVYPYLINKVRFYAGDVTGDAFSINGSDAQLIQHYFVNDTPFAKGGSWTFWNAGETISSQTTPPDASYPVINLAVGSNKTADIVGLCTGDFNCSFNPTLTKSISSTLNLVYGGTVQAGISEEFELPVRVVNASNIGAISLILNFPADLVEIKDVDIINGFGQPDWNVQGNELRIGSYSMDPVSLAAFDNLITLHLKTTAAFLNGASIRLSLASNPLNELADDHYEVIGNAVLSVNVVESTSTGLAGNPDRDQILIRNFPNPFAGQTTFAYSLPVEGMVIFEIRNMLGNTVKTLENEIQEKGSHLLKFDAASLAPGIYTAIIRLSCNSKEMLRSIKIVNNR